MQGAAAGYQLPLLPHKGIAHIGIGTGTGDDKCMDAVKQATTSPLLETSIENASHIIINVTKFF